ncbi:DEAD/DEAH box helicase, putative [Entamoeba histolytica HM-1:IMSS-B]|uniref:ATP-dependent RNA helicase n=6 Tax=Entamoeba histolytica TaxID=5759 RepID=C4M3R8_ENTH1|nr:DEAD/DEAH box helicase, putative [Entamoeba histolytica HM-1:IMSS]EMD43437.1 ATP-dependent RNA helicase DBP6, putative [Entamoeba histolytica KU27]EMH77149.1 DEAD/DEAH box helicase, putative [Entamoeba histolytica HM-1:IMSS-B]EMS16730.1 ATP-dependent RNA helicase DBP6, putative [Entamoeba histolytica HM-3:IMSS]ENY64927.1 ATP-dependent RNA helicase DBP6, putative [Entamoeba histolytica HM-1:IMSS-A]GAT95979.1 dead deah box helicase putative [Entamoeba histolytica]|eukprot:XP_651630.1 DEAD/DEAH box helicase, putative [Entamoeba histolytica HM-1:IMSS]
MQNPSHHEQQKSDHFSLQKVHEKHKAQPKKHEREIKKKQFYNPVEINEKDTQEFHWEKEVLGKHVTVINNEFTDEITKILDVNGIKELYPMQKIVQQFIFSTDTDIAVRAPTGSGKTLAYTLPLLKLINPLFNHIQVVILIPTLPLALQVSNVMKPLLKTINCNLVCLGESSIEKETSCNSHVIVTTPIRLLNHLSKSTLDLKWLQYLIYDETDKLLTIPALFPLLNIIKKQYISPQYMVDIKTGKSLNVFSSSTNQFRSLLFSATLSSSPKAFKQLQMNKPLLLTFDDSFVRDINEITQTKYVLPSTIENRYTPVLPIEKDLVVLELLKTSGKSIIFCNSNNTAFVLFRLIQEMAEFIGKDKKEIGCIISSMKQKEKLKVIKRVENDSINVFITTDLMSRGIDIKGLKTVINFDCPVSTQLYVHRAGRTGRAGNEGICHTIVLTNEVGNLKSYLKKMNNELHKVSVIVEESLIKSYNKITKLLEENPSTLQPEKQKKHI